MNLIDINPILEYMDNEYCECSRDHGYYTHDEDMEEIWCKICKDEPCTRKINWGVRRTINKILSSKIVLQAKKVKYSRGSLYEFIERKESHERNKLIWKII